MFYTVTLNPSLDYALTLSSLHIAAANRAVRETVQPGGKGINVSLVLAALGIPSTALGFTAGFTGEELLRLLTERHVDTRMLRLPDGMTRINVKLLADTETEINGSGPAIPPEYFDRLLELLDALREGDTLVLAGSVPPSLSTETYAVMMKRMADKGVRCAVDTSGEALVHALPLRPFIIKPNRQELEELCGEKLRSREDIIRCGRQLQDKGARNVLISLGADGAVLLDEAGGILSRPALPCHAVNTVGAGDSMLAGFLAGYDKTHDYAVALTWGLVCGTATAASDGLAAPEQLGDLLEKEI